MIRLPDWCSRLLTRLGAALGGDVEEDLEGL